MKEISIKIWLPILIIISITVSLAIYLSWPREEKAPEIVTPKKEIPEIPADWKTYRNEDYGFEFKYPGDYTVDESLESIRIEGPNGLTISISKSTGGLVWVGETIVKEEQLSLRDYLNYYYKVTHFDDPISGAYKDPEYKEIMSTGRFVNIISPNRDVEIWRERLTPNLEGFESIAYLMNKNDRITIIEFTWGVISYNHDEIFGENLLTQFDKILSTFKFIE
jgi:hypothetical protein